MMNTSNCHSILLNKVKSELDETIKELPKETKDTINNLFYILYKIIDESDKLIKSLLKKIRELRKEKECLENKIKKMQGEIDSLSELINSVNLDDFNTQFKICEKITYKDIWNHLSGSSKNFLVTAELLYKYCEFNKDISSSENELDYAPVIIEICRTVESELKSNVFDDFISSYSVSEPSDGDKRLREAIDGVRDLTMGEMFPIFEQVKSNRSNYYNINELEQYLKKKNWNVSRLGDKWFINKGKEYCETRNEAAHGGDKVISENVVVECRDSTNKILDHFIGCKK